MSYAYDALFNPISITKTAKPGSALAPLVQKYSYVVPVSSLPNFEEAATSTDPNNNVVKYTYSTSNGTLLQITQPSVNKPGVGATTPKIISRTLPSASFRLIKTPKAG